jgi:peptide/nickel transport system permease protein
VNTTTPLRRIAWRLLAAVGVLWGAATLAFVAMHVTAGDAAIAILGGPDALPTPQVLERVRRDYGLDQPLHVQYAQYLVRLLGGDLGESYRLRAPVARLVTEQLGPTLQLAGWSMLLAFPLAVAAALLTAGRTPRLTQAASGFELVVSSTPPFVLGILLLLVFSFQLRWFPASGNRSAASQVLPALTVALPLAALMAQVLRQELEGVLEQPFITMARARGLSEAGVRLGHALRHALIPVVTLAGFLLGTVLASAVVVETLFARQGIGRLMLDATTNKDIPLVLGITLLSAAAYVAINLVVDLINAWIDPRATTA